VSWQLILIIAVVVVLGLVANSLQKKPAKRSRKWIKPNYGNDGSRSASPRPAEWGGSAGELLDGIRNQADLYPLKWWEFEEVVGELFRRDGFQDVVVLAADKQDGGIDVRASWKGLPVIAQAKHKAVGEWASIEQIGRFCHTTRTAGAGMGYFVTTGGIGKNSRIEASKADPPVTLIDGGKLWRMIEAQRAGKPSGLLRPTQKPKARVAGCALALLTLGRLR